MRPYSPGGRLNTYATALLQINSEATPQSASFTAGTTGVSNPVRSPSFRSSPSDTFWSGAFATGSPPRLKGFYPYPGCTPDLPRSQAKQYLLRAVGLSPTISQKTYLAGYERSRPSIRGYHLRRWCYRGGCHQSCPHPYSPSYLHLAKRRQPSRRHSESPYHCFQHCRGFAPAAPRRARTLVSVSFWGPPLSWPLEIIGLVSHYPTNNHNPPQSRPTAERLQFTAHLNL